MLHTRFLVGVIISWLCLAACTSLPTPKVTQPTTSPQSQPTVSPRPLPTFTSTVTNSAWQVWHVSFFPKTIYALALQDDRIWVGTEYGLWQLDPKTSRVVRHDAELGGVNLVLPIENGQAWAAASKGIFFFDGQQWQNIMLASDTSSYVYRPYASMFAIDMLGNLWLEGSSARGGINVYRYYGHIPTNGQMTTNHEPYYNQYTVDQRDCELWPVVADHYLHTHRSAEECRALQAASQTVPHSTYASTRLILAADNSIWQANLDDGSIIHWVEGISTTVALPAGTRVTTMTPDPSRGVWIGTDRGLAYTDGTEPRWLPDLEQYFTAGRPIDLGVESSGNVWVQTAESTLNWLPADRFSLPFETIPGIGARAMATADGLWITHGTDLIKIKLGDRPSAPSHLPVLDGCKMDHLTVDRAGDVWGTTLCGLAWQYQPAAGRWLRHALTKPAPLEAEFDPIRRVVASADGTVFAVGRNGLGELTAAGDTITATPGLTTTVLPYPTYRHRALLPSGASLADRPGILNESQITADREGGIWLAIIDQPELWHYANGQVSALAHPLQGKWVSQLHVDQRGRLWEVGNDQQLAVHDGQTWRTVAMPDLGIVRRIVDDPAGRLWFLGDRGIAVYEPAKDNLP